MSVNVCAYLSKETSENGLISPVIVTICYEGIKRGRGEERGRCREEGREWENCMKRS